MSRSGAERRLERLDWTVVRRLDGLLQGDYRTIFKGQGLDLADIREYTFGDDVRHIDWNVTARLDMPYVREYHEDREINAHFLLDLSPSVDFGTVDRKKRDLLIDFTALLARLLTRHGNRVGATLYGSRVERSIPARGGRVQVLRILNELEKRPRLESAPLTSLSDLLESGMRGLKRRSLVFVVSDFFSAAGWEQRLARSAGGIVTPFATRTSRSFAKPSARDPGGGVTCRRCSSSSPSLSWPSRWRVRRRSLPSRARRGRSSSRSTSPGRCSLKT